MALLAASFLRELVSTLLVYTKQPFDSQSNDTVKLEKLVAPYGLNSFLNLLINLLMCVGYLLLIKHKILP